MVRKRWIRVLIGLILVAGAGCSQELSPRSPQANADPERLRRAEGEMDVINRRNLEAESRYFRTLTASRSGADRALRPASD